MRTPISQGFTATARRARALPAARSPSPIRSSARAGRASRTAAARAVNSLGLAVVAASAPCSPPNTSSSASRVRATPAKSVAACASSSREPTTSQERSYGWGRILRSAERRRPSPGRSAHSRITSSGCRVSMCRARSGSIFPSWYSLTSASRGMLAAPLASISCLEAVTVTCCRFASNQFSGLVKLMHLLRTYRRLPLDPSNFEHEIREQVRTLPAWFKRKLVSGTKEQPSLP
mmetsp:Transcript_18881/g.36403  ORF Transcript_18881/g.36403 Transcript_18881/m.36403 type:complete len:233 (-) Transcript_18881:119-817(-)